MTDEDFEDYVEGHWEDLAEGFINQKYSEEFNKWCWEQFVGER